MLTEEVEGQRREGFATDLEKIRAAGHRMLVLIEENFTSARETMPALVVEKHADSAQWEVIAQHPTGAPGLLLVVDDDAANREVLSRRLERQGHEVMIASNGLDALRLMVHRFPFFAMVRDAIEIIGIKVSARHKVRQ